MNLAQQNKKLVIFDWGGIVFDLQNTDAMIKIWHQALCQAGVDIELSDIDSWWKLWHFNMLTKDPQTIDSNFLTILKEFGVEANSDTVRRLRLAMDSAIKNAPMHKPIAEYIRQLIYDNRCCVGLLSNTEIPAVPALTAQLPISAFDYVWLSFELGMIKPDEQIYRFVEKDTNILPQNILFFDDNEKNLIPAQNRGWHTFLVDETMEDTQKVTIIAQTIDKFLGDKK